MSAPGVVVTSSPLNSDDRTESNQQESSSNFRGRSTHRITSSRYGDDRSASPNSLFIPEHPTPSREYPPCDPEAVGATPYDSEAAYGNRYSHFPTPPVHHNTVDPTIVDHTNVDHTNVDHTNVNHTIVDPAIVDHTNSPARPESPLFPRVVSPSEDDMEYESHNAPSITANPSPTVNPRARTARSQRGPFSRRITNRHVGSRRIPVEDDPENQLIKDLRVHQHIEWTAIATYLNQKRLERGEPQTMTQAAVYSRFVRNAPRVAAARGEVGFNPREYMYLRHVNYHPNEDLLRNHRHPNEDILRSREATDETEEGELRIPRELRGNIRQRSPLEIQSQELETSQMTLMLREAVETVDRNFYTFVADEMEKKSGKCYDPRALRSRHEELP